ncbi:MAG: DAK2 domain-containing protein, partial [Lachnospiraceae bacterium]|nr:DAK2 domain-containing protein [Lachnospiraceae bacterium]
EDFLNILDAAVGGVQLRGKAVQGEKTMLDAMIPAVNAIRQSVTDGKSAAEFLSDGVAAAKEGVEYTKTIAATKGRASYLGERSIGHQDPGATSSTITLECIRDFIAG